MRDSCCGGRARTGRRAERVVPSPGCAACASCAAHFLRASASCLLSCLLFYLVGYDVPSSTVAAATASAPPTSVARGGASPPLPVRGRRRRGCARVDKQGGANNE